MAVTLQLFNTAPLNMLNGVFDFDAAGAFVVTLHNGEPFNAVDAVWGDVSNTVLASANGYAQQALANPTLTQPVAGQVKFDAADTVWTAAGGPIGPATQAIIRHLASGNLLAHIDFGESKTADDSTQFKIIYSASGILQLS